MRIAYFDTIAGISGDMTLGAFVSAGVSFDVLKNEIRKLPITGVELEARHLVRSGITSVKIDVVVSEPQSHHRNLGDVVDIIEKSRLSEGVKKRSKSIFSTIAEAEAKIHGTSVDKVHFHEVGALDAIVDIVGTAVCLEQTGAERVYTSPVKLGNGGFVNTDHGKMPIPTPATAEILRGYPTILTDIPFELTTPTGAAIIKALSAGVLVLEQLNVESIGYGAGSNDLGAVPNLLRVFLGELSPRYEHDELVTIETNIDNMNPEVYPYVIEKLLNAGAHDAYLVPVVMKKGRPGILLSALASRAALNTIVDVFFQETTTLGLRIQPVERRKLARSQRDVRTSFGLVKVKVIHVNGTEKLIPEYEECRRLALEKGMPLIDVYENLERELRG